MIRVRLRPDTDGTVRWLEDELRHFIMPIDLEPPAIGGNRAPDSDVVRHSGDRKPTSYGITATGNLLETTPERLRALYWRIKRDLKQADQVWRYEYYLNVDYALLGSKDPDRGQTAIDVPIAFAVSDMRWRNDKDEVVN